MSNNIIYADLSTYNPQRSIHFYEAVFGWEFHELNGYYLAYSNGSEVVGLYKTPEKFQKMKMPHFWMTYIKVPDVNEAVEKARVLGGIIEMVQLNQEIGDLALIRDPQGAGFTVYSGNKIQDTRTFNQSNKLIWNELHISDINYITTFYEGIFNWKFISKDKINYQIINKGLHIADALVLPNYVKGKYEYWVCTFGVPDLEKTSDLILKNGGALIHDEGFRRMFSDNSGEAFFYIRSVE